VWLTQAKIAELFGVDRSVVTKHLKNIFSEGELNKDSTCAKIAQVQTEGQRQVARNVEFYNLDVIISVGYRVNSTRATHFRIWATQILKGYIIKAFLWMMRGSKIPIVYLAKIILKNNWQESEIFVPVNEDSIKKLPIFTRSAVRTMIQTRKSQHLIIPRHIAMCPY